MLVSRNNAEMKLEDVVIYESGYDHGVRFEGEVGRFVTMARFAAEDGSTIRSYHPLPKEITIAFMRQWGFIE